MWEFDGSSNPQDHKGSHIHKLQEEGTQSQQSGAGWQHSSDELFSTQHEFNLKDGEQKGGGVGGGVRKKESLVQ